jgi:uncharacterized protein YbjT (DUF2867 family)
MKKVLIAGSTGYLGRFVTREFKERGFWVRILTRENHRLDELKDYADEIYTGEATDPSSIEGICKGIDFVFSSLGITRQKDNLTYMDVDYRANLNLLVDAKKNGVNKFVYVSLFGAEKIKHLKIVDAHEKFVERLKESGIGYSIIRPTGYFSDMLEVFEMAKKGRAFLFGSGNYKMNPIHGKDLAKVCVDAFSNEKGDIPVGGPNIYTYQEVVKIAFQFLGKKEKITYVPLWVRDVVLFLIRSITSSKTYGPIEFLLTVLTMDLVAPQYGNEDLSEFFKS